MGFLEMSEELGQVTLSFSDECEGWYALTFPKSELASLKAGTLDRIHGKLEYDDLAEFFPGLPEDGPNGNDSTSVVCKASKTGALADRYD